MRRPFRKPRQFNFPVCDPVAQAGVTAYREHMNTRVGALVVTVATLLLTGCAGLSGAEQSSIPPSRDQSITGENAAAPETLNTQRSVVSTGSMLMAVESPLTASDAVADTVERAGGRVDSRTETEATDFAGAEALLTLRIPQAVLDETLDEIGALGDVIEVSVTRDDVTTELLSVDAQIRALESSVARLETLLGNATVMSDLIELESALTARQAELDSLKAQQAFLDEQIALSTIYLTLREKAQTPAGIPTTFVDGLTTGLQALMWLAGVVVVVIGFALPWLLVAAVIVAIVFGIVRLVRRRNRSK